MRAELSQTQQCTWKKYSSASTLSGKPAAANTASSMEAAGRPLKPSSSLLRATLPAMSAGRYGRQETRSESSTSALAPL